MAKYFFLGVLIIFAILLARNPFGTRTLIPNMEPYPDTFHYIVPARSLASGGPFMITREGRTINPSVPPLYSLVLIPFYLVNKDPRMFYFANVLLSIISLYLLYLILKKVTDDIWIIGITLFVFVTNFFMYWFPQWAMAENLILPIFLLSIYLLLLPINKITFIAASLIPFLAYGTKYAYLPFSIAFFILYVLKIFLERKTKKIVVWVNVKGAVFFIFLNALFFSGIVVYQSVMQGFNPVQKYIDILAGTAGVIGSSGVSAGGTAVGLGGWFSNAFFAKNFPAYIQGFTGEPTRFLWDFTPILPRFLIILSWLGLFVGVLKKNLRFLALSLLFLLLFHLVLISAFGTLDMRYIYHAVPTFILGFALLLIYLKEIFAKKKLYMVFVAAIFVIGGFYVLGSFQSLKLQVVLNLKYSETPWYYISVLKLNDYFTKDKIQSDKKPVVISPMPPYYIDYFSNGNYNLLPLDENQEFRLTKIAAWGPNDYSDLHALYKKYISGGYILYVSTYGLGNEFYLHQSFDGLYKDFNLIEVQDGCYTQCKIYKLELKNVKNS